MKLLKTIWSQSKWPLIAVFVILIVGILLIRFTGDRTDLLLTGLGLNGELTEEGTVWLKEDLAEILGALEGQSVAFADMEMSSFANEADMNQNYYLLKNIMNLVSSNGLDYFIMDKTAMENLISQNIFLDLSGFFTETELTEMEQNLIWAVAMEKDQEEVDLEARRPVALKLEGIPFFEENSENELYFAISHKTTRLEACRTLWEHILNWNSPAS